MESCATPTTQRIAPGDFSKTITRPHNKNLPPISPVLPDADQSLVSNADGRRARQRTVTVESTSQAELNGIIAETLKQAVDGNVSVEDVRVLATKFGGLLQRKERESNARIARMSEEISKSEGEGEMNLETALMMIQQFEVWMEELTSGQYVHVSKIPQHNGLVMNGHASSSESEKITKERDSLKTELSTWHEKYSQLYNIYLEGRTNADTQRQEYEILHKQSQQIADKNRELSAKMVRMHENATAQLEQASRDIEAHERESEKKTLGLRAQNRALTVKCNALETELISKKAENEELRKISNELVAYHSALQDVSEGESTLEE